MFLSFNFQFYRNKIKYKVVLQTDKTFPLICVFDSLASNLTAIITDFFSNYLHDYFVPEIFQTNQRYLARLLFCYKITANKKR